MADRPAGTGFWRAMVEARPTREGVFVILLTHATLLTAFTTHRPTLFAAAALLLALYLVGHAGAALAAVSVEASWECPDRVHAAEVFPLRILLRNRGSIPVAGMEIREPGARRDAHPALVGGLLRPGESTPLEVRGRVRRRGRHRLEPPGLALRWPFGLAECHLPLGEDREILAYPRRIPVPPEALRSPDREAAAVVSAAASRGGALFRGLRDWAPGDAPRSIAWRQTARHGRLLSREFEREDAGRAIVLLDADARDLPAPDRATAVERACSIAASLLLRLRARGRRTAFAAFTPEPVLVPSVLAARGMGRALEALALLVPPDRKDPRRDPLALLPASALRGARVLLVRAAPGRSRNRRGPGGSEIREIPALRATFEPERVR